MEREITLQDLFTQLNNQEGEFIIHVYWGEEDKESAKKESL